MKNQSDNPLNELLNEWRVENSLPPRFQENVWRRIEHEDAPSATLWQLLQHRFENIFARPAVALSYVTVLIAAGLVLGFKQGQESSARAGAQLEARYVQAVDPYQKVSH